MKKVISVIFPTFALYGLSIFVSWVFVALCYLFVRGRCSQDAYHFTTGVLITISFAIAVFIYFYKRTFNRATPGGKNNFYFILQTIPHFLVFFLPTIPFHGVVQRLIYGGAMNFSYVTVFPEVFYIYTGIATLLGFIAAIIAYNISYKRWQAEYAAEVKFAKKGPAKPKNRGTDGRILYRNYLDEGDKDKKQG